MLALLQTRLKRVTSVALCRANKQLILSRVAFYCGQSKAHLCSNHAGNQHVNMPHLSAGWIILAKEKHSQTWNLNLKRLCWVKMCFLWDLLLQLKEKGRGLFLQSNITNTQFPQRSQNSPKVRDWEINKGTSGIESVMCKHAVDSKYFSILRRNFCLIWCKSCHLGFFPQVHWSPPFQRAVTQMF